MAAYAQVVTSYDQFPNTAFPVCLRQLLTCPGGEIGVSSKEGSGSTFAFFFLVKRSDNPADCNASPEKDTDANAMVQDEFRKLGHEESADAEQDQMPKPLKTPVVEDTNETANGERLSDRFQHTAEAKSEPREEEPDQYDQAENNESSYQAKCSDTSDHGENVETPKDADHTPSEEVKSKVRHPDRSRSDTQIHVLLVEDNIINQRIVSRKLQAKGFTVTTANNGQDAVKAMKDSPASPNGDQAAIDVILMDQEMPIMDGNSATAAIRDLESGGEVERVPIIGVSANVRGEQIQSMKSSGMDDVISKPYRMDDMVAKINHWIDRKP